MNNTVQINIKISPEQKTALEKLAEQEHKPVSQLVREFIRLGTKVMLQPSIPLELRDDHYV
jgi:hypothetical protein